MGNGRGTPARSGVEARGEDKMLYMSDVKHTYAHMHKLKNTHSMDYRLHSVVHMQMSCTTQLGLECGLRTLTMW